MNPQKPEVQKSHPSENLTMREIEKLARALPDPYSVNVFETFEGSGSWTAEIFFNGREVRRYGLETGRRIAKIWKTLFGILHFVTEFCPGAIEVKFTFRGCDFIYSKSLDEGE